MSKYVPLKNLQHYLKPLEELSIVSQYFNETFCHRTNLRTGTTITKHEGHNVL